MCGCFYFQEANATAVENIETEQTISPEQPLGLGQYLIFFPFAILYTYI